MFLIRGIGIQLCIYLYIYGFALICIWTPWFLYTYNAFICTFTFMLILQQILNWQIVHFQLSISTIGSSRSDSYRLEEFQLRINQIISSRDLSWIWSFLINHEIKYWPPELQAGFLSHLSNSQLRINHMMCSIAPVWMHIEFV